MVKVTIYIEGGGDSKELHTRCREGFRTLLERCGFAGRMPKLVACGSREQTWGDFRTAHRLGNHAFMLVDSEDRINDIHAPWSHLQATDRWNKPDNAVDEQVLLMTTCMETWIIADRAALQRHYGHQLIESSLPKTQNLESLSKTSVFRALELATRNCANRFSKGKRSFQVLAQLDPAVLVARLPSFERARRILESRLR